MRTLLPRDSMSSPCKKHNAASPGASDVGPSGTTDGEEREYHLHTLMRWCIHRHRCQWSRMGSSQQGCLILWTGNLHRSKSKGKHPKTQESLNVGGVLSPKGEEGRSCGVYVRRWCRWAAAPSWEARWWTAASGGCDHLRAPMVSWHRSPPGCPSPLRCLPIPDSRNFRAVSSGLK